MALPPSSLPWKWKTARFGSRLKRSKSLCRTSTAMPSPPRPCDCGCHCLSPLPRFCYTGAPLEGDTHETYTTSHVIRCVTHDRQLWLCAGSRHSQRFQQDLNHQLEIEEEHQLREQNQQERQNRHQQRQQGRVESVAGNRRCTVAKNYR